MTTLRRIPATLWHLLLVTLLGLPLTTPLWMTTAVTCTHDGHLHVHRIAALVHGWQNGVLFTRWIPDLAFGYGYPFFVYREPLPLYLPMGPHLLGMPLPAASNLFYALCILAGGWFMFLWVRDVMGTRAALVSAVAYMAAPYVLIDALIRGNSPESLALPLFPLLLWMGRRWLLTGTAVTFLTTALGLAFLSLSHNISTLIFVPTLLVYLLVLGWSKRIDWQPLLGRVALVFGLGLGMMLFYTGGALLELNEVTLQQSTTTRNNDFRFNFAGWDEILAPVSPEDPNLINPPLPIRLGWVPVVLAIFGAASLLWRKELRTAARPQPGAPPAPLPVSVLTEQRLHLLLMLLGTAVYLFMALPESQPLWEGVPLIDFVQFPWRFVGRAALPVAFLAGAPFAAVATSRLTTVAQRAGLPLAVALLILEAFPLLYPRVCGEEAFPTILNVHRYEHITGLVGVDPEGSYFPKTVEQRPQSSPLEADYLAGRAPQRFDLSVLPEGATAVVDSAPLGASAQVDSPVAFTARYLSFAFPGWTASVDGAQVPIVPGDPDGLITFDVPAGSHEVSVRWQSTPLRTTLSLVSLLAFAGVIGVSIRLRRRPGSHPLPASSQSWETSELVVDYGLLVALALLLLAGKLLVVDRLETPLRHAGAPPVDHPAVLQAAELRFEGYNLSDATVAAGETFDIDLAWTAVADPDARYQSNVWLAGPDGLLWSDKETQRPRIYEDMPPTLEWQAGEWAWDSREVAVLPGTPPGTYDIVLTLFDRATLQPLTLTDGAGSVVGPTAVIGQIAVETPAFATAIDPQYRADAPLPGTGLTLRGYNQDRTTAVPGDPFLLTLFWERTADAIPDAIKLALVDAAGAPAHAWDVPVIRAGFVNADWPVGETLRAQHALRIPAGLDSGTYRFVVQGEIPLETLVVTAPERTFDAPAPETGTTVVWDGRALFGEQIALRRVAVSPPADAGEGVPLTVTLLWTAVGDVPQSYRVFVHLVDAQGNIVAQSDGEPANWRRPTSGWVPDEFIVDSHALLLPAERPSGPLSLRMGLYDPATGARLPTAGGDALVVALEK